LLAVALDEDVVCHAAGCHPCLPHLLQHGARSLHVPGRHQRGDDRGVGDVVGAARWRRLSLSPHRAQHGHHVLHAPGVHVPLHERGVHPGVGRVSLGKQRHLVLFPRLDDVLQHTALLVVADYVVVRDSPEQQADVGASFAHGLHDPLGRGDVAEADVGGDEGVERGGAGGETRGEDPVEHARDEVLAAGARAHLDEDVVGERVRRRVPGGHLVEEVAEADAVSGVSAGAERGV
ncbi:Os11g0103050, partial [Oryza sativa Japonica Group]